MLALSFALLLATATEPAATPLPEPSLAATPDAGIVLGGIGFEYRDVEGPAGTRLNPFAYPNVGLTADTPVLFLEVSSPLPVLIPDLIATLFHWLATGEDDIVLWHAINGSKEPGAIRFGDATARYPVASDGLVAFEAGVTGSFTLMSVLLPEPGPDTRIGVQPKVAAPSLGFKAGLPDGPVLRAHAYAGNGWTHLATWNPILGVGARSAVPFGETVALELRGDIAWQRLDLTSYRDVPSTGQIAGTDWYRIWSVEARISLRFRLDK